MEDYLETIAGIKKEKRVVRVKDISKEMKVKTSSVTAALGTLSKNDLVIHERYGYVDLTKKGEALAGKIQKRHDMLIKFLTEVLNVSKGVAEEDACRIEHVISTETYLKLTEFLKYVESHYEGETPEWLSAES
jgi:DtxR family Mn-dependent transcriptional regulator